MASILVNIHQFFSCPSDPYKFAQNYIAKIAYKIATTIHIDKILTLTFCCYFQVKLSLSYVTNDDGCITSYPPSMLGYNYDHSLIMLTRSYE